MKINLILTFLLSCLISLKSTAQSKDVKGLYVGGFASILGNPIEEDSLLSFAQKQGFNYLALYNLHIINEQYDLTNTKSASVLANFISRAKKMYGVKQVGGVGENFYFFRDILNIYNRKHTDANQKIDVYNLEFEFWVPTSVEGMYCQPYLTKSGLPCDSSGAFAFYMKSLFSIDSLAHASGVLSETYIGWINQNQCVQIGNSCDRVLLSCYAKRAGSLFNIASQRLKYLGDCNKKVNAIPIFSAEGGPRSCGSADFMGTWLNSHLESKAYEIFLNNYIKSKDEPWKQNVNIVGYQWFDYACLADNNSNSLRLVTNIPTFKVPKDTFKIISSDPHQVVVSVNTSSPGKFGFVIKNSIGQLVYSQNTLVEKGEQKIYLPLDDFPPGIYLLQCNTSEGVVFTGKLIK
jgi:hypothetical protein